MRSCRQRAEIIPEQCQVSNRKNVRHIKPIPGPGLRQNERVSLTEGGKSVFNPQGFIPLFCKPRVLEFGKQLTMNKIYHKKQYLTR